MKISLKIYVVLSSLSIIFSFNECLGQVADQTDKPIPLNRVLDSLEQAFDVKFSYVDDHIGDLHLEKYPSCEKLEICIEEIEQNFDLKFEVLNERFITILKIDSNMQTFCGILFDAETKQVLEGATVMIKGGIAISDEYGKFLIKDGAFGDSIIVQYLGYQSKKIAVQQLQAGDCAKIGLAPLITMLKEVTVQNFLIKGIDKKAGGSLSIDLQETEILPGLTEPDILHTVQKLPGIHSINEKVSDINVRGGTNDQNLILWEGIKMYKTGHFFGLISAFNPYLIQKVRLIKNGSSAKYSEGISSIIDLKTFDKVDKEFEAGVGINMLNADAYLKIPVSDKIGLHFSARRSFAEVVNSPTFSNYFERAFRDSEVSKFVSGTDTLATNKNFYFYDYSGKLLYDISRRDKLRISYINIFNQIGYEESESSSVRQESKNSELQQSNRGATVKYERVWSDFVTSSSSLAVSSYNLVSTNFDIPNNQRFLQENQVLDVSVKSSLDMRLSDHFKLQTGYQFNEIGVSNLDDLNNPNFRKFTKEVLNIHGQFTEIAYNSSSGQTLSRFGLRVNYFEEFNKFRFEPRFALNQLITDHITVELLGEAKSQVTTQIIDFQTDFLGVEKRRWVLVNEDDIPIVTSGQVSLGAHYKKNNILLSVEGYLKQVDGIITSSQGFQNQLEFVRSSGSYISRGIDILLNHRLEDLNYWTSYSYSKNIYDFKSLRPSQFPNNLEIRHASTLGVSYRLNKLDFSVGLNYQSGRPITEPENLSPISDGSINYQTPNSSRLGHYLRPDLSAKYHFMMGDKIRTQVGFALWNFTDQTNVVNQYYIINKSEEIQKVKEKGLGLTPNLMFRITL